MRVPSSLLPCRNVFLTDALTATFRALPTSSFPILFWVWYDGRVHRHYSTSAPRRVAGQRPVYLLNVLFCGSLS